jgi:dolichol-phosphate mannosyltransferase
MIDGFTIAVVVPCYRVSRQVSGVLAAIGAEVDTIFVVDDGCPEQSGARVEAECRDPRVTVLRHEKNQGVGGAMVTGYRAALAKGCDIVVKIDGDGQMNPALLPAFVRPLTTRAADYAKGNRFFWLEGLASMPRLRLFGNAALSFVAKVATGYWDVMDPTNGFTAIHRVALTALPLDKIDRGYFFESDMLFRLYTIRAVVRDVPMHAHYAGEPSSLSVRRAALQFPGKFATRFWKRCFYTYLLRDFNAGSAAGVLGALGVLGGGVFGVVKWLHSIATGTPTPAGTVMLAAIPVLLGGHLLISAFNYDIGNVPRRPLQTPDAF